MRLYHPTSQQNLASHITDAGRSRRQSPDNLPLFYRLVGVAIVGRSKGDLRMYAGWWLASMGMLLLMAGCAAPQEAPAVITVYVSADGEKHSVQLPGGGTVMDAIDELGLVITPLDRAEPPLFSTLEDGFEVRLIRVREEITLEQVPIPFEQRIIHNEALAEGEEQWLQLGENGMQEITIRRVYEDGVEISSGVIKTVTLSEPIHQIKMIGVQRAFTPYQITGRLAYLQDGNAWVMEGTTGNRRLVINSGDLDGRVFSLSQDGAWLLFTRHGRDQGEINGLWVVNVAGDFDIELDLGVANVVHFADWRPNYPLTVAYSTVEPRIAAPGWQANNDLSLISFDPDGFVAPAQIIVETNSGGLYGWWGTEFLWSPDGEQLAYARPDEVGLVDLIAGEFIPLVEITPYQTFGDWAWVPAMGWGPDGDSLFHVTHSMPEISQEFNLVATRLPVATTTVIASQVGMFSHPSPSPILKTLSGENASHIAFLQALYPGQSDASRYQLAIVDVDGSNLRGVFPVDGTGLEPQKVVWSPKPLGDDGHVLAVIYQGDLWLVDAESGEAHQVTGDRLISRIDWK